MSRAGTPHTPMTRWSRYETSCLTQKPTDHWSKLRSRCTTPVNSNSASYQGQNTEVVDVIQLTRPPTSEKRTWASPPDKSWQRKKFGNDLLRSCALFDQIVTSGMNGRVPGTVVPKQPKSARNALRTSLNERARSNFKYWPMDRPAPTKFGKYGIGSYKTVLGLGNAPRT